VVIEGDILKNRIPEYNKIVANLPYSISSPLILKLLRWNFDNAVFTFQDEFVKKLLASKGESCYGRITVLTHYKADVNVLEHISRDTFYPKPKVDSVLVQIKIRSPLFNVIDEPFFWNYINFVFTQRNKKLRNVLVSFLRKKIGVKKKMARTMVQGMCFLESKVRELSPEEFGITSNQTYQRLTSTFS
jgi:16S rRNA (adenine1518-N6/adenine1519-N6)-dimethyltransferase